MIKGLFVWLFSRKRKQTPKITKTYCSVSGCECDVFIQRKLEIKRLATLQSMSVVDDSIPKRGVCGSLVELVANVTTFEVGDMINRMVFQWQSEYGDAAYLEITDVEITQVGIALSVDDITTDAVYAFKAGHQSGWKAGRRVRPICTRGLELLNPAEK